MSTLPPFAPPGNPEVRVIHLEDEDADVILEPTDTDSPDVLAYDPNFDPDFDPDPAAPAAMPVPVGPYFAVYAARITTTAHEFDSAQMLGPRYPSVGQAVTLADHYADDPPQLDFAPTHILIQDHRGRERYRRRLAA